MITQQKKKAVPESGRGRAGQATVEMVLITAFLTGLCIFVLKKFNEDPKPVYQLITAPWKAIAGMMESGVWENKNDAVQKHPGQWYRAYSAEGQ